MTTQPLASLADAFAECAAMDAPLRDQLAAYRRRRARACSRPSSARWRR